MKCNRCGADSRVVSTRSFKVVLLKRSRECFNLHRFVTYEVYPGHLAHAELLTLERGHARRVAAHQLKLAVKRSQDTAEALGRKLGVSGARIRQIRKELSCSPPAD